MIRVGPQDIRVGDVAQIYGKLKRVTNMKLLRQGRGRLLYLDDGSKYRLPEGQTLPAQDRPEKGTR